MGIKPEGTNPVVVPPDNVQSRWGAWEASIDVAGQQAGEVFAETHAIATSANSVAATALQEARTYQSEAVAATDALEQAIDPEHPDSHIFRLIHSIDEAQNQALELHSDAIAANEAAIQELTKAIQKVLYIPDDATALSDDHWTVSRSGNTVTLTARPGWVGYAVLHYSSGSYATVEGGRVPVTRPSFEAFPVPGPNNDRTITVSSSYAGLTGVAGTRNYPATVVVQYTINPGVARHETVSNLPLQTMPSNYSWQTVAEWEVPQNTTIVASAELSWANKTWTGDYGMRITLDDVDVTSSVSSATAPIIGHRPRTHKVSVDRRSATGGQMLRVQARANHGNSLNRQVRDVKLNVTWIDGAA